MTFFRVANLNDTELIAKETNCLKSFIAKGISLASFTHARCLDLGKGTKQDTEQAKKFYKKVSVVKLFAFFGIKIISA